MGMEFLERENRELRADLARLQELYQMTALALSKTIEEKRE